MEVLSAGWKLNKSSNSFSFWYLIKKTTLKSEEIKKSVDMNEGENSTIRYN